MSLCFKENNYEIERTPLYLSVILKKFDMSFDILFDQSDQRNNWSEDDKELLEFLDSSGNLDERLKLVPSESFEEWVKELFQFEYCSECGGDWYDHVPNILLGNWFARCKIADNPNYKVRRREK